MGKYILSLDQGTTSSRAVLIDKDGDIVDIAQKEIKQFYPSISWVEEDPVEIYESQLEMLKNVIIDNGITLNQIDSIGITNQRETTILWNKKTGKPVYNAIGWQCKRSKNLCNELATNGFKEMIQLKTGLILDSYFSATKIRWILDNVNGVRKLAENGKILFGTVDTWLLWNLTEGKCHMTDYSNASRTMLFNINTKKWDLDILKLLNIPESILPEVHPTSYNFGYISPGVLDGRIPINCLIGDQQSALFGQLCTNIGDIKNTYGTGCFTLMNIGEKPIYSPNGLLTTIAWVINSKCYYAVEGSVFVGGAVIQWLRDELELIRNAEESEIIARSVDSTNGVAFISTFQGVGTPYWKSDVKGEITGLTISSKKAHIVRAALESIAYRTMEVINTMKKDSGIDINSIKVDGGASRNNFLMGFQADICNTEIIRPINVESTALGAAYMAGLYSGFWKDIEELKGLKKLDKHFKPTISLTKRKELIKFWENAINRVINN